MTSIQNRRQRWCPVDLCFCCKVRVCFTFGLETQIPAAEVKEGTGKMPTLMIPVCTMVGPLGIDVEYHRPNRSFDAIASFAFGPRERLGTRGSTRDFYRIWCLREAMSKANGKGLAEAADNIDRVFSGPETGAWETAIEARRWLLAHITPEQDFSLAIAVNGDERVVDIEWSEKSLDLFYPGMAITL